MRLGHAEAEERQRCFGEDRGAELRGREHDQRRQRVRQHVAHRDAEFAHADRRAASTNGSSRSDSVLERMTRAT